MKKHIIFLITIVMSISTYAQTAYKGNVVNNNQPLAGATIVSSDNPENGVMTDYHGNFEIILNDTSEVTVSYLGYKTITLNLNISFNAIQLENDSQVLNEIVISASREQQKRSEVPAAISVINAKTIDDTKAFSIDQLVNQVPGVFMSSSKATSNEQHMMAVRSPISTKELFLYLEDGLQIRPTAVFNHNALLEMNNTALGRVEILKGPASSIYGSEAIGGSFNFITKNPTRDLTGSIGFQINDLGLTRYDFEISKYTNDKFGIYLGTHHVQRKDGPVAHSDYEKFAVTFKTVYDFNSSLKWVNVIDYIDYRSDMTGSLSEIDYTNGNYESDQTFTERVARSFRFRSTLDKFWSEKNKTSFNFIFRDNVMDQNPSYRVRQFRNQGQLTGFGSGELNSNQYNSFVGLIQHKMNFDFKNSSLIVGATTDYSPQEYKAETIGVTVDIETGQNTGFNLNSGDFILNYEADIFNYAGYFQYEISPIEAFKITAALRYDKFVYDYNNHIDGQAGARDTKTDYDNFAPKLGVNYNFSNQAGIYAGYSNGFTPPQTSSLYRNSLVGVGGEVFDLKPSEYNNYEIGGYFNIANKWKLDAAIYLLEGKNTLVTLRNENDEFFNSNAGKTRSFGIEYGITYKPIPELTFTHNGSFAKHRYINFFEQGVDYSDTDMETAPNLLGITLINYKPEFFQGFSITAEHELVGKYNTSFENQVDNGNGTFTTSTYNGHNVINLRASYSFQNFEIWLHALNILDELYSPRASYNAFQGENSYTAGNPRAFHLGIKYNF